TDRRVVYEPGDHGVHPQRVTQIDDKGERDWIVDRPLGIATEWPVFDAEAALGPPPVALPAADRIDGVITEGVRLPAWLDLRRGPRRLGLRTGVGLLGRRLDQNARRFNATRPLVGFIVGSAGCGLRPPGSLSPR